MRGDGLRAEDLAGSFQEAQLSAIRTAQKIASDEWPSVEDFIRNKMIGKGFRKGHYTLSMEIRSNPEAKKALRKRLRQQGFRVSRLGYDYLVISVPKRKLKLRVPGTQSNSRAAWWIKNTVTAAGLIGSGVLVARLLS